MKTCSYSGMKAPVLFSSAFHRSGHFPFPRARPRETALVHIRAERMCPYTDQSQERKGFAWSFRCFMLVLRGVGPRTGVAGVGVTFIHHQCANIALNSCCKMQNSIAKIETIPTSISVLALK